MLSMRLNEKWHAIIATAGAASLSTACRSGPTVRTAGAAGLTGGGPHPPHARDQRRVTAPDEIDERLAGVAVEGADRRLRSRRGLLAVAESVDDGDQRAFADTLAQRKVARFRFTRQRQRREGCLDPQIARRHFFIVIVVPRPTTESTSNSSISRFAPGNPAPTPCEVE